MKIVELKREIDTQFREVETRFREVDVRFREVDVRFDALESRLTSEHETTRRYMEVLIEQVKAEYRLGLDKMTAIEQRLASVAASNASEHATFTAILQQHEIRITALQAEDDSSEPPSSI